LTLSAGPMDPRHANAVADIDILYTRADLNNGADHFMSKDERLLDNPSQLRPIAIRHVQIGVAYSANFNLNQNFTLRGFGKRNIFNYKWSLEVAKHSSFHLLPFGECD
ncbi:MAG: hypothetical protein WBW77_20020, partial [Candidatus Sulfotelmatobacter sp.]